MEELVRLCVSSIADQLVILYPDGPSEGKDGEESIQRELEASLVEACLLTLEESAMEKAIPIAIQQWTNRTPVLQSTTSKPKSMSLFDQLLGGGFQPPVTIDDVKEAVGVKARLAVFHRVSYLDDLLLDWNEIRLLLSNDLQESLLSDTALDIIKIHRKYYDLGRASSEYLVLQYGICHNIFDAITAYVEKDDTDADLLFVLIRTWSDIFVDLIQRGVFMEDLVGTTESTMLGLLADDSKHHIATSTRDIRFSTAQVLALVDTHANWFRGWVRCTSPGNLLNLLEKTSILPTIISRCCSNGRMAESGGDSMAIQSALRNQSLFILASIVEKARVSCFPFHLASSFFGGNEIHVEKLIDIFLQSFATEESNITLQVCSSALEDILSGCSGIRDFLKLVEEVNGRVSSMPVTVQSAWETIKTRSP